MVIDPKVNQLAAKYVAAAMCSLFPKITLLHAKCERFGFSVEAILPKGFSQEAFNHIEERIASFSSHKTMEMLGFNAADYLKSHHQVERAKIAKSHGKQLLPLIEIGDFIDLCLEPVADHLESLKLIEVNEAGDHYTLIGASFADAGELKAYLKRYKELKKCDHVDQFQIKNDLVCLDSENEQKRFDLICKWRKWVQENGGAIFDGPQESESGFSAKLSLQDDGQGLNGLLDAKKFWQGQLFNASEQRIDSFFKSIDLQVSKTADSWYAPDVYGTLWKVADRKTCPISFERFLALLIENNC